MTVAELSRELVSVPSHEDESEAGDLIEGWLREETDADVTRDGIGNVIASKGSGESLALVGHHDVVPPDDSQVDGEDYVVYEEGGRLYGRGAADMKGAVAAGMCAFRDAVERRSTGSRTEADDADPNRELVFASFVGEEVGGEGARFAIDAGFSPDYAVVGEGSTNYSGAGVTDVAIAHRGRRGSTITARGEAAHASEPEAGENAIYRACEAIAVVRDFPFPAASVLGHELCGSVAVTEVDGGSAWNVIPERCDVTVDERTVPGERAPLQRVEAIDGVERTVDQDLLPMACEDGAFADAVLEAARTAQPGDPEHVTKPHATDAGWLAEAGTSCVVCGPAEPGEAHTAGESVSIDVLERCYRIYRGIAETF